MNALIQILQDGIFSEFPNIAFNVVALAASIINTLLSCISDMFLSKEALHNIWLTLPTTQMTTDILNRSLIWFSPFFSQQNLP